MRDLEVVKQQVRIGKGTRSTARRSQPRGIGLTEHAPGKRGRKDGTVARSLAHRSRKEHGWSQRWLSTMLQDASCPHSEKFRCSMICRDGRGRGNGAELPERAGVSERQREAWRMRVESRGLLAFCLARSSYCLFGSLARAAASLTV